MTMSPGTERSIQRIADLMPRLVKALEKLAEKPVKKPVKKAKIEIKGMEFGVCYSFDCPWEISVKCHMPKNMKLWQVTEGDSCYELGYLEGRWEKGKHRKMLALLNQAQFEKFLKDCDLVLEETNTAGILGAPWGNPFGTTVALSFGNTYSEDCDRYGYANAYVTPLPACDPPTNEEETDEAWDQVVELFEGRYGRESSWGRHGSFDDE